MFAVIGKGMFTRDAFIQFLINIGLKEHDSIISQVERSGRLEYGRYRFMLVR